MHPKIKHMLRKLAAPLNIGAIHHRATLKFLATHLRDDKGFYPGTIIDVGVYDGTYDLYDAWPSSELLMIEPAASCERALKAIQRQRKSKAEYVLAAAGAQDCDGFIADFGGVVDPERNPLSGTTLQPSRILRLDTIATTHQILTPSLLKVDVQGRETEVLFGAEKTLQSCEVVLLEIPMFRYYEYSRPLFDTFNIMNDLGYCPYDIYDGLLRPFDNALGQIDVAFVKRGGQFQMSREWGDVPPSALRSIVGAIRSIISV